MTRLAADAWGTGLGLRLWKSVAELEAVLILSSTSAEYHYLLSLSLV